MRTFTAFTLGMLSATGIGLLALRSTSAQGGDPCPPRAAGNAVPAAAPAATREPALRHPFLMSLVGDWACDCSFPTGQKAQGGASARLVMDGTALLTEATVDWKDKDGNPDPHHALGLWKLSGDGKVLRYWGFSSHDSEVDMLVGTVTDGSASVAGVTRWGPMRLTLSMNAEGGLVQQLWINQKEMGTVGYTRAGAAAAQPAAAQPDAAKPAEAAQPAEAK